MEDRSFKAYLMSDPQHTARGGSTRQSVWVFVSSYLFSMSVCLCACRVDVLHLLSGTGLCAVSLTFCASLVVFPSHVEP